MRSLRTLLIVAICAADARKTSNAQLVATAEKAADMDDPVGTIGRAAHAAVRTAVVEAKTGAGAALRATASNPLAALADSTKDTMVSSIVRV
jgi:hypothetical protein